MPVRRRRNARPRPWTDYKRRIRSTATVMDLAKERGYSPKWGAFSATKPAPPEDPEALRAYYGPKRAPQRRGFPIAKYRRLLARYDGLGAAIERTKTTHLRLPMGRSPRRQKLLARELELHKARARVKKQLADLFGLREDRYDDLTPSGRVGRFRGRDAWTGRFVFANPASRARLLARLEKLHQAVSRGVSRRGRSRKPSDRQIAIEKAYARTLRAFEYAKRSNPSMATRRRKKKNPWLLKDARGRFSKTGTPVWTRKRGLRHKTAAKERAHRAHQVARHRREKMILAGLRRVAAADVRAARTAAGNRAWTAAHKRGQAAARRREQRRRARERERRKARLRAAAAAHAQTPRRAPQRSVTTIRRAGGGQAVAARRGKRRLSKAQRRKMTAGLRRYWAKRRRRRNPSALIVNPRKRRRTPPMARKRRRGHHRRRRNPAIGGVVKDVAMKAVPALATGAALAALDTKVLNNQKPIIGVLAKVAVGVGGALALRKKPALAASVAAAAFGALGYQAGAKLTGGIAGGSKEAATAELAALAAEDEEAMGLLANELQGMGVLQVEGVEDDAEAVFEGTDPLALGDDDDDDEMGQGF